MELLQVSCGTADWTLQRDGACFFIADISLVLFDFFRIDDRRLRQQTPIPWRHCRAALMCVCG